MAIPYIPKITTGGLNAAITARENGFAFEVTHVSYGTGGYIADGTETALQNEIAKVPIAGGGRVAGMLSLVINTLLKDADLYIGVNQPVDIKEIGFWNENVLFAIYANNTVLVRKIADCQIASVYTLALKALQPVDAANITVVVDQTQAIALAVLGEHLSVTNPHPQYATVLMLQDEALTREQNDLALSIAIAAEITNRQNGDNAIIQRLDDGGFCRDLATFNNYSNQDLYALLTSGERYFSNCINAPSVYGLIKTWRENNSIIYHLVQSSTNKLYSNYRQSNGTWAGWREYASLEDVSPFSGLGQLTFLTSGSYQVYLKAGETVRIILIGGGGGGGAYETTNGQNGGNTEVIAPEGWLATAYGGIGGYAGYGAESGSFVLGPPARVGSYFSRNRLDVMKVNYRNDDAFLPVACDGYGNGGLANPNFPSNWRRASDGGRAGHIEILYRNDSNVPRAITINVGYGGASGDASGTSGAQGLAAINVMSI